MTVAEEFLRQTTETDPQSLFTAYAEHLLNSAEAWELPVRLEKIRERHGFKLHTTSLKRRGFLLGKTIFINDDDATTVQRFTEAHEFMESLTIALRNELPCRLDTGIACSFEAEKESWCEQGAAALLLPKKLFFPAVEKVGISLRSARQLAEHCKTSLTATMRRMLDTDIAPCIFTLLKEGHRKSEHIPSKTGQGVLWGKPEDWDPPAKLRVWRRWHSPQVVTRLYWNESISSDTLIYQTFTSGIAGQIYNGRDRLEQKKFDGHYEVESVRVTIGDYPVVMALIHF